MTENNNLSLEQLQQQAGQGHVVSQFALGLFHLPKEVWETKEGWEFVNNIYTDYILAPIDGSMIEPEINTAFEQADSKNEAKDESAFLWFKKAAEQGHKQSQYATARCYFEGVGIEQNSNLAYEWAVKAAEQNFSEAYLLLGDYFYEINDDQQALINYQNAVNGGISRAYIKQIKMVLRAKGVIDYSKAKDAIDEFEKKLSKKFSKNIALCEKHRFFGQDFPCVGIFEIDIPEEDDFEDAMKALEKHNKWIIKELKDVSFITLKYKQDLSEEIQQKEIAYKALQEKVREVEEMMSMFAHKFRSPLDAIIYNTGHENQPKLYIQAAQTMRGLLDVFSIISTDEGTLKDKLKLDRQGSGNLALLFSKTLDMILLHLLSASGAEKIQQHYLGYAKAHGLCDPHLDYKLWNEEFFELERQLQQDWEQGYAQLLSQTAPIEKRLAWLEQHFFKLELRGFDRADIQFKEYGLTESFLTILLNEVLVNAFKYYSSVELQPVVVEWSERGGYLVLSCRNPSIRSERTIIKGSCKGHTFLSALARKSGSQFSKPIPQDNFVVEFGVPNDLLLVR